MYKNRFFHITSPNRPPRFPSKTGPDSHQTAPPSSPVTNPGVVAGDNRVPLRPMRGHAPDRTQRPSLSGRIVTLCHRAIRLIDGKGHKFKTHPSAVAADGRRTHSRCRTRSHYYGQHRFDRIRRRVSIFNCQTDRRNRRCDSRIFNNTFIKYDPIDRDDLKKDYGGYCL